MSYGIYRTYYRLLIFIDNKKNEQPYIMALKEITELDFDIPALMS